MTHRMTILRVNSSNVHDRKFIGRITLSERQHARLPPTPSYGNMLVVDGEVKRET